MKAAHLGMITTGIVVALSMVAIVPAFTQQNAKPEVPVMLVFDVNDAQNLPAWCTGVAASLESHDVRATVFMTGKVAEQHPQCAAIFSANDAIDIGSKTYSYVDLTSIPDYTQALDEVQGGKEAVDRAGDLDSRLFRAPYGSTDQNIYSMLSRSGIAADFSYDSYYNTYLNGNFVRFNVTSYEGAGLAPDSLLNLESREPVVVNFDNSVPVGEIDEFISDVAAGQGAQYDPEFVNASDIAQMPLTGRAGS
jgi:peptidoglycan/xylan/chitin deacetylase (PgdA/CDA1 family)